MTEDTEVIEGEATEVEDEPVRALQTVPPAAVQTSLIAGGTAGLALMSDEEFERNLESLEKLRDRVDRVKKALMRPNVDYGTIPGTNKPALYKPGAETLLRTFGLADSYMVKRIIGDGESEPEFSVSVRALIHIGDTGGPVIAEGVGEANSWETKYRYRGEANRVCPTCGVAAVRRGKDFQTSAPNWFCDRKQDGCGANFADNTPAIKDQPAPGKAENVDPFDNANTLTKMGKKRALVDGILTATGTSGVFTQDEDAPGHKQQGKAGSGATPSGSGAPGPATAASGGAEGYVGPLREEPDGIRQQRDGGYKVELKMKVGNRNHTAIVVGGHESVGPLADLHKGDVIRVWGRYTEREWQEGKPPVKELLDVTRVILEGPPAKVLFDGGGVQPTLPTTGTGVRPMAEVGRPTTTEASPAPHSPPAQEEAPPPAAAPPAATPPAVEEERWADFPDDTVLNEVVTLRKWGVYSWPEPNEANKPPYFKLDAVREDGSLLQCTAPLNTLEDLGYLEVNAAAGVTFRWDAAAKIKLAGTYVRGQRARGWVLITALGDA